MPEFHEWAYNLGNWAAVLSSVVGRYCRILALDPIELFLYNEHLKTNLLDPRGPVSSKTRIAAAKMEVKRLGGGGYTASNKHPVQ